MSPAAWFWPTVCNMTPILCRLTMRAAKGPVAEAKATEAAISTCLPTSRLSSAENILTISYASPSPAKAA
jgi:hypothetical protein